MKVDQPINPYSNLLPQEKKTEAVASSAPGNAGAAADSSSVERDSSAANEKVSKYPAASPEEIAAKNRRADAAVANNLSTDEPDLDTAESRGFSFGRFGNGGSRAGGSGNGGSRAGGSGNGGSRTGGSGNGGSRAGGTNNGASSSKPPSTRKPPSTPTPAAPKPAGAQNRPSSNVSAAQSIVSQSTSLPPAPPTVAATVRNAFISAGANNMVASPFTVGNQFASSYFQSKLEAHSEMPGAPIVNADGTIGTVDPNATEAQKMDARLKGAEIKNEATSNLFIFLDLGWDAKAVQPSENAPTDAEGRLSNLEKTLDEIEKKMPELAERFEILYKPYVTPESSEAPTEQSRMDNIEKRQAYIDEKVDLLKTIQEQKAKKKAGV
ncbi:hypothetical protein C4K03_6182 [Pseudomonas synxantha]|uniref:Type III secretion effector protein n=1 Tax=Pseudomonas synxantha TaxID=47883 RepID=A0A3G7UI54_9PSED|nr:type III secretion effector protein [Pseudomonas synxantha]AZE58289.1 hypothetical protein C4K03_6182 [Pseudomonas synxantha]